MKAIDFYSLTRPVQDKLLSAFRGENELKPIMFCPATRPKAPGWIIVSCAATALGVAIYVVGLGQATSALARHPQTAIALYVLTAAVIALGVLEALAYSLYVRSLHFQPGLYLFPTALVDAREARLVIIPLEELTSVTALSSGLEVRLGGRKFFFPVAATHREAAVAKVKSAQERLTQGLDDVERRLLDPLEPPRVVNPFASDVKLELSRPLWLRLRWLLAAAFAATGVYVYRVRDDVSDARMFASAKSRDEIAAYQEYLAHGDDHRNVVLRELLPRAELRVAIAEGTVEAIDAFKRDHPDTDITEEVEYARRAALASTFEQARKVGTMVALVTYDATYPGHHLAAQLKAAKHALYVHAMERYKKLAPKPPKAADLAQQLVTWAERTGSKATADGVRGPTVAVRFRRVESKSLDRADDLVKKNPYYTGKSSLPSNYYDDAHVTPLEQAAGQAFADAFSAAFSTEVINFAPGPAILDAPEQLPEVTVPTIIVSYRVEPSGANWISTRNPRGIFLGMVYFVRLDFLIPGNTAPQPIKHVLSEKVPGKLIKEWQPGGRPGALEESLYRAMTAQAFTEVREHYLAIWFAEKKP